VQTVRGRGGVGEEEGIREGGGEGGEGGGEERPPPPPPPPPRGPGLEHV